MINKEKNEKMNEINALDICIATKTLVETGEDIFFDDVWHSKLRFR